jgi:beta-ribofuranosylaminobenzene 5'-phosphate synthase
MEAYFAHSHGAREGQSRSSRVVTATTTARLHFGFLDPSGRGSRPFGSFGLSLDRPRTRITLKHAPSFAVNGPEAERAVRYLRKVASSCGVAQAYALTVEEAIPPHAGLGSGTQLALAVGSAFAALEGIAFSPQEIAARLGRGARSGIGIATFDEGGVVLDSGPINGAPPKLVCRLPFPPDWRVLLIFDPETSGLAGDSEIDAFDQLPDFPPSEIAELHRRVTQGALPALAEGDFAGFCNHVGHLQAAMGEYFAPLQGGPYTSTRVSKVLAWLRDQDLTGLGQSSWGPTGFAFIASQADGERLLKEARARAQDTHLRFALAQGRNEGARIETGKDEIP